jgi:hypothetical protein
VGGESHGPACSQRQQRVRFTAAHLVVISRLVKSGY